jgi:hypothetical protein
VAKVHKVLHPKRPELYPILDERLRKLYGQHARDWLPRLSHLPGLTVADSPPYWAAFRGDLVHNHDALENFRTHLAADDDPAVRSMAKLTRLRLLDIVAWSIATRSE